MPQITAEMFESKKLTQEQVRQSLQFAIWRLEGQFTWNNDTVSQTLMDLANQMGIKLRDFLSQFFTFKHFSSNLWHMVKIKTSPIHSF
jgi:glutamyl-tRNA synthetase